MTSEQPPQRFTFLGKLISLLLVGGLIYLGVRMILRDRTGRPGRAGRHRLKRPIPRRLRSSRSRSRSSRRRRRFRYKDNIVPIEISEYAGYAGLIAANGGLDPTEGSLFFKNHGFKVKLTVSEEESWSALNEGKIAASVTTADVLAAYGRQLHVVVPAQIGFSRGADGVDRAHRHQADQSAQGQTIATAQFTEVDFFIRYLAQEAGLAINALASLDAPPIRPIASIWSTPRTGSAPAISSRTSSSGQEPPGRRGHVGAEAVGSGRGQRRQGARADHQSQPPHRRGRADRAQRLCRSSIPRSSRASSRACSRATAWCAIAPTPTSTSSGARSSGRPRTPRRQLAKVHLSNLPENRAFFSGAIDAAGSFGGIYQSAVLAYGSDLIKDPPDPSRFIDARHLDTIEKGGLFKEQKIAIAPIRSSGGTASVETDPLLSKDIRFLFEPNSATLDLSNQDNIKNLDVAQAAAAGQSRLDDAAARPRRQRARRGFPQAGRRGLRPDAGACAPWS